MSQSSTFWQQEPLTYDQRFTLSYQKQLAKEREEAGLWANFQESLLDLARPDLEQIERAPQEEISELWQSEEEGFLAETGLPPIQKQRTQVGIFTPVWKKGYDPINFEEASTHWIFGKRFSGKSSLNEGIGTYYLANGSTIFDLFGARDNESLAWLRSPFKRILLVCGDKMRIDSNYPFCKASDFKQQGFLQLVERHYEIVLTCPSFYLNEQEQYRALSTIVDCLKWRSGFGKKMDFLLIREAGRLLTSRIVSGKVKNRFEAEQDFIDLHNEAYHSGLGSGIDTLRPNGLDISVRDIANYTYIKKVGRMTIPREYFHLGQYYTWEDIRMMNKEDFILFTDNNALSSGFFTKVPWHIERGENIMETYQIRVFEDPNGPKLEKVSEDSAPSKNAKVTLEMHKEILEFRKSKPPVPYETIAAKLSEKMNGETLSWQAVDWQVKQHNKGLCLCVA